MSKSIGDFFINIMPKFDKTGISKGASAFGTIGKTAFGAAAGIGAAGIAVHSFTSGIAKQNADLIRSAQILGMNEQALLKNRQAFELAGASGGDFDSLMKNILASKEKIKRGEGAFGTAAMQGFNIAALTGTPEQAVSSLRDAFGRLSASGKLDLGATLGLNEKQILVLSQTSKTWNENMKEAAKNSKMTEKEMQESLKLERENIKLSQGWRGMKRDIAGGLMGSQAGLSGVMSEMTQDKEMRRALKDLARAISELTGYLVKFLGSTVKTFGKISDVGSKARVALGFGSKGDEQSVRRQRKNDYKKEVEEFYALSRKLKGKKLGFADKASLSKEKSEALSAVSTAKKYDIKISLDGVKDPEKIAEMINQKFQRTLYNIQDSETAGGQK